MKPASADKSSAIPPSKSLPLPLMMTVGSFSAGLTIFFCGWCLCVGPRWTSEKSHYRRFPGRCKLDAGGSGGGGDRSPTGDSIHIRSHIGAQYLVRPRPTRRRRTPGPVRRVAGLALRVLHPDRLDSIRAVTDIDPTSPTPEWCWNGL